MLTSVAQKTLRRRGNFFRFLALALAARRQRQGLKDLPAERLRDLGLSDADAAQEAARPIWDVPDHWMR